MEKALTAQPEVPDRRPGAFALPGQPPPTFWQQISSKNRCMRPKAPIAQLINPINVFTTSRLNIPCHPQPGPCYSLTDTDTANQKHICLRCFPSILNWQLPEVNHRWTSNWWSYQKPPRLLGPFQSDCQKDAWYLPSCTFHPPYPFSHILQYVCDCLAGSR